MGALDQPHCVVAILHVERWNRKGEVNERKRGLPMTRIQLVWVGRGHEDVTSELGVCNSNSGKGVYVACHESVVVLATGYGTANKECDDGRVDLLLGRSTKRIATSGTSFRRRPQHTCPCGASAKVRTWA